MKIELVMFFNLLILLISSPLAASPLKMPKENCSVEVASFYKTGQIEKNIFKSKQKSKAACEKARRAYQTNFAPDEVVKVEAKMSWGGK